MLAIDPSDESFAIRVSTIVDVLIVVGGMGEDVTREQVLAKMLSTMVITYDSKETVLLAMIEISEDTRVHYLDSRDDRIYFCDTVFGGAVYMMDCGDYRAFYHNEQHRLAPRGIPGDSPSHSPSLDAPPPVQE